MINSHFIENISVCREKYPHLDMDRFEHIENSRVVTITSREGVPTFRYEIGDGKSRYFHSTYDPLSEAREWTGDIGIDADTIVVVLGAGFFYHISELIKKCPEDQPIVIIERDEEIVKEAFRLFDLKDLLNRDGLHIFVGDDPDDAVKFITRVEIENSFRNIEIMSHKPSVQTFPGFYDSIRRSFSASRRSDIHNQLRYPKFIKDEVRVLLLTTQYFLMGEVISAMKRLDVRLRLITIEQEELGREDFIEEIIKNIIEFKPDFIFTINHLGIDREGALSQFLTGIEMPLASWYVDNPNLIIKRYLKNSTPYCTMFLWDRNSVGDMHSLGFEHAFYLPLGVDERRFRPMQGETNPLSHLACDVAFAGNSMVEKVRKRLKKVEVSGGLENHFRDIALDFCKNGHRHIEDVIRLKYGQLYDAFEKLNIDDKANFETALLWEATRIYRLERVKRLIPFSPLIVGDPYWSELLDSQLFKYHRELSYYTELPYLYNVTKINFNATSMQMKGAVNQRVFDVPASKGFLLTDFQEQMGELFDIGKEVVCYSDPGEIEEMAVYFLKNETERARIAEKGYKRVISNHTYVSRVSSMIETMRRIYS